MNDFVNVLKDYWQLILAAVVFILSFILQLIKKKPVDNVLTVIYELAVHAVNDAEVYSFVDPNVKGLDKLKYAVAYVQKALLHTYPNLDVSKYHFLIERVIESILTTPQKKGGNVDGEKKTHD